VVSWSDGSDGAWSLSVSVLLVDDAVGRGVCSHVACRSQFSGPRLAVDQLCVSVCPDDDFPTNILLTWIFSTAVQLDLSRSSQIKVIGQSSRSQKENVSVEAGSKL